MSTNTTTTDSVEMHDLELVTSGPTLLDYADLIIKAIAVLALVLIAMRLP